MKSKTLVLWGTCLSLSVFSIASINIQAFGDVPVITSFSPSSATISNGVTVLGNNFGGLPANNTVYFGAVRANVVTASPSNLLVTVPDGATLGPITDTVGGLTAFSSSAFLPTFFGNGILDTSSLTARVNLAGGTAPARVVFGDLDGDGKPDLVVANAYDGSIWVYRNISTNGTLTAASFAPPAKFFIGGGVDSQYGLALGDLDGDGRLDIVTANRQLNLVSILQNQSSPGSLTTNSFGSRVDIAMAGGPNSVAVGDLDGDGKPEIVVANVINNTVSILRNIGVGNSITAGSFAVATNLTTVGPTVVAISDLDGDGKPDVLTANSSTTRKVAMFRNIGSGSLSFAAEVDLSGADTGETMAVGDLDGDGKPDVVVGSYTGGTVAVYRNISTPGTLTAGSFAASVSFAAGGSVHTVAIGDLDGDGRPDIALVAQGSQRLSFFKNTSVLGSFTASSLAVRVDFAAGNNPVGIAIGDLDGDGRPDIAIGNSFENTVSIYRNVTPTNHPPIAVPDFFMTPTNTAVSFAAVKLSTNDLDADGDLLSVTGVSASSARGGTVTLVSGLVTYTPPAGFGGIDAFAYTVSDGHGGTAIGIVTVAVGNGSLVSPNIVFGPAVSAGNFNVRFAGIPGLTYTVEAAPDLAGPWAKVANLTAPASDQGFGVGVFQFSEPVGGNTTRFYRTVYPAY